MKILDYRELCNFVVPALKTYYLELKKIWIKRICNIEINFLYLEWFINIRVDTFCQLRTFKIKIFFQSMIFEHVILFIVTFCYLFIIIWRKKFRSRIKKKFKSHSRKKFAEQLSKIRLDFRILFIRTTTAQTFSFNFHDRVACPWFGYPA